MAPHARLMIAHEAKPAPELFNMLGRTLAIFMML